VHVVPATPDRPKTVTEPELWAARHAPEPKIWPRTLVVGGESPEPVLTAPSLASFGIETFGSVTKVAMAQTFERQSDASPVWPASVAYAVPANAEVLPIPAAHNFRYSRVFRWGRAEEKAKPKPEAKRPVRTARSRDSAAASGGWFGAWPAPARPARASGHQLSVARPPINLAAPQAR
jgi:hypothetical protein